MAKPTIESGLLTETANRAVEWPEGGTKNFPIGRPRTRPSVWEGGFPALPGYLRAQASRAPDEHPYRRFQSGYFGPRTIWSAVVGFTRLAVSKGKENQDIQAQSQSSPSTTSTSTTELGRITIPTPLAQTRRWSPSCASPTTPTPLPAPSARRRPRARGLSPTASSRSRSPACPPPIRRWALTAQGPHPPTRSCPARSSSTGR